MSLFFRGVIFFTTGVFFLQTSVYLANLIHFKINSANLSKSHPYRLQTMKYLFFHTNVNIEVPPRSEGQEYMNGLIFSHPKLLPAT